jgi:hypothetical protein
LTSVAGLVTACVALLVAIGGYVQLILRRSVFPCIEFDLDLVPLTRTETGQVVQIVLSMKNVGPGVGFITDPKCRIMHRRNGDEMRYMEIEPLFEKGPYHDMVRGAVRNYIQPGVTQWYRKPFVLDRDVELVDVSAKFDYHIKSGPITWFLAGLSMIGRPDTPVVPYNARKTFYVGDRPAEGPRPHPHP